MDFNYAILQATKSSAPIARYEIIQPEKKSPEKLLQITSLPNLKLGFNGIKVEQNGLRVEIPYSLNLEAYRQMGENAVEDVKSRAGKKGENLGWIGTLQTAQLKRIDEIFNLAQEAKEDGATDLVVIGLGGSRYPNEALVKAFGKDANIHFYSAIDERSFENFSKKLNFNKTKFLIVSKSGGTLETTTAYNSFRKLVQNKFDKNDVAGRFIAMTNPISEKSKLRQTVDKGEIEYSGLVHDEISGGYSMFDDATLFSLVWGGMGKEQIKQLLDASLSAQKEFMNPDINRNEALRLAAFNVDSVGKGKQKNSVNYFGDEFEGFAKLEKQLKNEGLKSNISTSTNIGPEFLHYVTEGDLDSGNTTSFYTFVYVKPQTPETKALINGAIKTYAMYHPVAKIELKDTSAATIARLAELKHFETLYTGNMLRQKQGKIDAQKPLPEVMQTNVNKYKSEVKKNFDY